MALHGFAHLRFGSPSSAAWSDRCRNSLVASRERRRREGLYRGTRRRLAGWSVLATASALAAAALGSELHPYIPGFWVAVGLGIWATCNAVAVIAERKALG